MRPPCLVIASARPSRYFRAWKFLRGHAAHLQDHTCSHMHPGQKKWHMSHTPRQLGCLPMIVRSCVRLQMQTPCKAMQAAITRGFQRSQITRCVPPLIISLAPGAPTASSVCACLSHSFALSPAHCMAGRERWRAGRARAAREEQRLADQASCRVILQVHLHPHTHVSLLTVYTTPVQAPGAASPLRMLCCLWAAIADVKRQAPRK